MILNLIKGVEIGLHMYRLKRPTYSSLTTVNQREVTTPLRMTGNRSQGETILCEASSSDLITGKVTSMH